LHSWSSWNCILNNNPLDILKECVEASLFIGCTTWKAAELSMMSDHGSAIMNCCTCRHRWSNRLFCSWFSLV
jgi:hypothetical protein